MTQLKVTCPACGHVRVNADDVRIVVSAPPKGSYYVFGCPDCSLRVRRPVTADVVEELVARGVPAVRALVGAGAGAEHTPPPAIG
ncbi:MAG TPA: hypothetical protein VE081_12995 [Sporichthyaceae bacterium]|nr:hypothetical protein [Sporichthyaceae bacterium]